MGEAAKKPLRIGMVHAPNPLYAATQTYGARFVPLWAPTLASFIPDDGRFQTSLVDCRFDKAEEIEECDAFLYSGINQDTDTLDEICRKLRQRFPNAIHFIGGPITTSLNAVSELAKLDAFDHICIGDGEEIVQDIVEALYAGDPLPHLIKAKQRFEMKKSVSLSSSMLDKSINRYYGGVVEVSRGCPFLCEFCDIRTLPDNNRPHLKPAEVIVEELDYFCDRGVNQILLACDNFIGDLRHAEEVVDKIIEWRERTGNSPGLYTWLTINLYKMPKLMEKMRHAGFDMLFIGVESFDQNSLLETAKVQNTTVGLVEPIREIQSYGFVVVAGLIFGFDSDSEETFDNTLVGLEDSALLSGDPSFLIALPTTPLYRRMKLSGRLRDLDSSLGGFKFQSNIRFLQDKEAILEGHGRFVSEFIKGDYQYKRLRAFFDLLERGNYIAIGGGKGFGSMSSYAVALLSDWNATKNMMIRLMRFAMRPTMVWAAMKGLSLVFRRRHIPDGMHYFQFWFFAWTNAILKYSEVDRSDFDIESVGADFLIDDILPKDYGSSADEPIPSGKIKAQLRATEAQLKKVIEDRSAVG